MARYATRYYHDDPARATCASCWSRPPTGSCPRSARTWAATPSTGCASAASRSGSTPGWSRRRPAHRALRRRGVRRRHAGVDRRRQGQPGARRQRPAARRARAGSRHAPTCAVDGARRTSGRPATTPPCPTSPTRASSRSPSAQHAVRQAKVLADNIVRSLRGQPLARLPAQARRLGRQPRPAQGRRRRSTASSSRGFPAWFMHRTYHMSRMPTFNKKVRVVLDWTLALFFRRDIVVARRVAPPARGLRPRQSSGHQCLSLAKPGQLGISTSSFTDARLYHETRHAPVSQLAEDAPLKGAQCGFESHRGHRADPGEAGDRPYDGTDPAGCRATESVLREGQSPCRAITPSSTTARRSTVVLPELRPPRLSRRRPGPPGLWPASATRRHRPVDLAVPDRPGRSRSG